MSAGILTNAGRDLFALKQGAEETLVIDRFLLANISGLDPEDPVDPDEALPDIGDRVATLAVTRSGYVSPDQVVYSLYLGTEAGDYTFNWVGLLDEDDTLVAVRYIDPLTKTATSGGVLGNAITRNFLITYTDAQAITSIEVNAATWQLVFDSATTEQKGLVELATQGEMNAEIDTGRVPPVDVVATYIENRISASGQQGLIVMSSSGSYVKPDGLRHVRVTVLGGGGGGGSSGNAERRGGGGGAGSCSISFISAASIADSEIVIVAAGGLGASAPAGGGGTGGNSSFGSLVTSLGGRGGVGGGGSSGGFGGEEGIGDVLILGGDGSDGSNPGGSSFGSGDGGASYFGGGGRSGSSSGGNGAAFGSGGGGAVNGADGGDGADGIVIIEEFF